MPNNVVRQNQNIDVVVWETLTEGVRMIADWVEEVMDGDVVIYGIPRGGMIPAIALVHQLEARGVKARFLADIYHITPTEFHKLVIIDEICDSGDTFRALKGLWPMARTATVYHRIGAKFIADYSAYQINDDRWLQFPWEVPNANS